MMKSKSENQIDRRVLRPGAFLVLIGLAVLGFIVYANAINHPFVHDDAAFIRFNPNIARWDNIGEAFCKPEIPFKKFKISTPYYRPVLEILYRAQHAVFGMNAPGYHFFNIFVHILNSFLVFWVLRFWGVRRPGALMIAVFFLIHPLQSESVACISGISNLAVAFFLLMSFLLYAKGIMAKAPDRILSFMGAGVCFVIALFTKEQGVLFPFFLLVYELFRRRRIKIWDAAWRLGLFFFLTATFIVLRVHFFPDYINQLSGNWPEFCLRILAVPRIILMYLGLVICPVGLHYYRSTDILVSPGWSWGVLIALCAIGWYFFAQMPWRLKRSTALGLLWGFLFLAPAFNIAPLINEYSFVFTAEHFIYLSLAGLLVGGLSLGGWIMRRIPRQGAVSLIIIVVGIFCVVTVWQNNFWRGEIPLFERALRFEPGLGRVHLLLAKAYINERRWQEGLSEYGKGLKIMEDYVRKSKNPKARLVYQQFVKSVYSDRGHIYIILGDLVKSSEDFRASLAIKLSGLELKDTGIDDGNTANNLAFNLLRMGKRDEAKHWWCVAVKISPHHPDALNNLGMLALQRKDKQAAIFYFTRSLRADPEHVAAKQNLLKARKL